MSNVVPVQVAGSQIEQAKSVLVTQEERQLVIDALNPCPDWHAAEVERQLCRDVMAGITALRAQLRKYLPQKELETDKAYEKRVNAATFYNQFSRAVDSLVGRVFSRTAKLVEPDAKWEEFQNDVDLEGNNLHVFCEEVFSAAITEGISFIIADMPSLPVAQTQEEEQAQIKVRRPYWVHLRAYEVIGWKRERVNGIPTLMELRTLQSAQVEVTPYVFEERKILRIYKPDSCIEYEVTLAGVVTKRSEYKMSLGVIPIVPVYTKRLRPFVAAPPLFDMATLCIRHYQSTSSQNHILDYSRFPLLFGKLLMLEGQTALTTGASAMVHAADEKADLRYVEHTGAAIGAGEASLDKLERQIAMLSYEPLLRQTTGTESATRATLDTATASSALQAWAGALRDALEQALVLTSLWKAPGYGEAPDVSVNTTHGLTASLEELNPLLELRKSSQLSRSTLWKELYRRGVLGPGFDAKEEEKLLQEEGGMNELGEGALMTLVNAKVMPKKYLFETAKKKGLIPAELEWETINEELLKEAESGNNSNPMGEFDAMFKTQG